jgi:uncharacterized membrane protein
VVDSGYVIGMWHYVQNGQACGPVETAALQALLQNGSLAPDALIWKPDMPDWVPARSVAEFAASVPRAGTAPPVPPLSLPPKDSTPLTDLEKIDIEHNKVFAVLAYISILFLVPLLAARHSRFARYHTNQGIVLFLSIMVISFVLDELPIHEFNFFLIPTRTLAPACGFAFMIIGIIHAVSGEYKPLPLIGHFRLLN